MEYWRNWQERYREQPNTFRSSATQTTVGAAPGGVIYHIYWLVQPDEALLSNSCRSAATTGSSSSTTTG